MHLSNTIYISDMGRSVAFYEALGLVRKTDGDPVAEMAEFAVGDASIALIVKDPLPAFGGRVDVELTVPADGSLDRLFGIAREYEFEIGGEIRDEGFARVFWLRDPDGTEITFMERA